MSADKLYTPELLAASVELANWPPLADAALHGHARSPACGSTIDLDLDTAPDGCVTNVGMLVRACAVGQGAATVFARHAPGRSPADIAATHAQLVAWLGGEGALPDWPDLAMIAPARAFAGRHGAMLLPWNAALAAVSTLAASR